MPATKHDQVLAFAEKAPEDIRKLSSREKKDLVIKQCKVTQGYLQQMIHKDPGLRKFFDVQSRRKSGRSTKSRSQTSVSRPATSPLSTTDLLSKIQQLGLKDKARLLRELDAIVREEIAEVESEFKEVHAA